MLAWRFTPMSAKACARSLIQVRGSGIGSRSATHGRTDFGHQHQRVVPVDRERLGPWQIPEENGKKVERDLIALIKRAGKAKGITIRLEKRVILADPPADQQSIEKPVEPLTRRTARTQDQDRCKGRTALYRRAALQRGRYSDGALWRGTAGQFWRRTRTAPTSTSSCRTEGCDAVIEAALRDALAFQSNAAISANA